MKKALSDKSTIDEIRARFDRDVERFSNLETGQVATVDAPLAMELITQAAVAASAPIRRVLDIGCGAGNNSLRLLRESEAPFACDLCDLSGPMLDRAEMRVKAETTEPVRVFQGDFRELAFEEGAYDVIVAAAVLHHLRSEEDWEVVFEKIYRLLRPGGSFWVSDLVTHEVAAVDRMMWARYGSYLEGVGGPAYRDDVFAYIDQEDSPRPLAWQLNLLRKVGFVSVDVLHKNSCFAVFGGLKGPCRDEHS